MSRRGGGWFHHDWTDPDPYTRLDRLDGLNTRRTWNPPARRLIVVPQPHPSEVAFADGRAYAEGERRRTERSALAAASTYLADPEHGARRAMLVLAGHVRVPAEVVAR